jgi:hypothetical protein
VDNGVRQATLFWYRGKECNDLYLHFPIRLNVVVFVKNRAALRYHYTDRNFVACIVLGLRQFYVSIVAVERKQLSGANSLHWYLVPGTWYRARREAREQQVRP